MSRTEVPRGLIAEILDGDDDDRRFEQFCADLFTLRDGVHYETTAPSGDLGIDAQARITLAAGSSVVCATTQATGLKSKARADIDKQIARSKHIVRLHICFAKDAKNELLKDVEEYAKSRLPHAEIEVHGQSGLCDIAYRYQQPFLDNYAFDLDQQSVWRQVKADDDDGDRGQVNVLRIAITTVFHEEMLRQRELIMDTLIITALADGRPRNLKEISEVVGVGLKTIAPPAAASLVSTIESLVQRGHVRETPRGFRLTDSGDTLRDQLLAQGAKSSLDGRSAFKALLGDALSASLSDGDFTRLWKAVQRRLEHAFLRNGLRVVGELQSILSCDHPDGEAAAELGILSGMVSGLLDDIQRMRIDPDVTRQLAAVFGEMIRNRHSDAFRWISELGVKFIVICTLGLEPQIGRRVRDRVSTWVVIPDTHVILSYLCSGDEGHAGCEAVLQQLHRFSCRIWAMEPVLDEAVHHAEIANDSFRDWHERVRAVRKEIPHADPFGLLHADDNAFVKGYACEADGDVRPSQWQEYIEQFRGYGSGRVLPLAEILEQDLGAKFIPDDDHVRVAGRGFVMECLRPHEREVDPSATLRCEWDGRLLVSVLLRQTAESPSCRIFIMSDSDRLRHAFNKMAGPEKKRSVKISDPAAIACALAAVPGTTVNLECVRHFLFGGGLAFVDSPPPDALLMDAFRKTPKLLRRPALNDQLDAVISRVHKSKRVDLPEA